jgi:ADP-ribose pyrophosphatase
VALLPVGTDRRDMSEDELTWETLASTVGYDCPGFEVRHEAVRLPDSTETDFDYVAEPPAVVVLPFTADGDVVCIEEWRQAVDRVNLGLPAGTMEDEDAEPATAVHRELAEETGYEAESVEHLVTVEPTNGIANSVHHHYVAHGCEPTAEQALDFNESIQVELTDYREFRDAVAAGTIRDGRAVTAVAYYEAFGR